MNCWLHTGLLCGLATLGATGARHAATKSSGEASALYRLDYRVDLSQLPRDATKIRVWMPTPAQTPFQQIEKLQIDSSWPYTMTEDELGNRMAYFEGDAATAPSEIVLRCVVRRDRIEEPYRSPPGGERSTLAARFHRPSRMIPLRGAIRLLSERLSRGLSSDGEKIRAFYDYVVSHMRYSKAGKGWGQGDAAWACKSKYGNCTDFHSVLIGLARCQQVAARFVIGFPIPAEPSGEIAGYHCWAELEDPARGWIPVDASEAYKSAAPNKYFAKLPPDRVQFTSGRDLVLTPPQTGPPLNFFIYPYVEVDGQAYNDVKWSLHYKKLATGVTALPKQVKRN